MSHTLTGFTEVNQLPENDSEYEEDEIEYIVLDVAAHLPKEALATQNRIQIAGLATTTPFLRVGGRVLRGLHEELIGTEVLYTESEDAAQPPTLLASSNQRVRFLPVHLKSLDSDNDPSSLDMTAKPASRAAARGRGSKATASKDADDAVGGSKKTSKAKGKSAKPKSRGRAVIEDTPSDSEED